MNFSKNLVFHRIERRLSQVELAQAAHLPRWTIQLLECAARAPEPDEVTKLAAALGVSKTDLLSKSEDGHHGS